MARAMIILAVLLVLPACQSDRAAISASAAAKAGAQQVAKNLPRHLPDSCTAEMPAAFPSSDEAWVVTQKRWLMLRANRNDEAVSCSAWWDDYLQKVQRTNAH